MVYERIKRGWDQSSIDLAGSDAFWARSAFGLSLVDDLKNVLTPENVRGRLLDAGAGRLPYRHLVKPLAQEYQSLDVKKTHPELDLIGDVQAIPLPDASVDTVLCAEVLEHVPDPSQALREMFRILRPGGHVILTVPHLFYLHNEPDDYYRYTKYGLRFLLERAGFRVKSVDPSGGLFSFLQGLVATVLVGLAYGKPILWPAVFTVNKWVSRIVVELDRHTDKKKLFALHYVAVAEKCILEFPEEEDR